jgi:glutamate-1-semialdehyde 2,1-aminomutase
VRQLYNVKPDLFAFGKIIGGGLPVGAFAGKKDIMSKIAPLGNVYQAGTLSGNPLAMIAGITTLAILNKDQSIYDSLEARTKTLGDNMLEIFKRKQLPVVVNRIGSMISIHFCANEVFDFNSAAEGNNETFRRFFHHMLNEGIYIPPSAFESWFISNALSEEDISFTLAAIEKFN